jgi:hypothetical protein
VLCRYRGTVIGLLLVCSWTFLSASATWAGFIAMNTATEVEIRDGQVLLHVTATNQGDESAWNVRFEAIFPDDAQSSEEFPRLGVGETVEHSFRWQARDSRYRQLVFPVVTHYTDANSYPFSAVSRSVVTLAEPPPMTVAARIDPIEVDPRGTLKIVLRSVDGEPHEVRVRLAAPVEIAVLPRSVEAEVPSRGQLLAEFEVENFSGLVNSVYGVWAILSEETPGGIVESAVAGSVRILEPSARQMPRIVILVVLAAAALLFLAWQLGAFRRLRRR